MTPVSANLPSLSEMIPTKRIALNVQASDWKEAVRIAGSLLLRDQCITPEYIEAMIQTAEDLRQYIVIAPGIALPHARPDSGALKTGLSLVKLNPPVAFGNENFDPVILVFALTAVDKRIHVRTMKSLAELFLSPTLVDELKSASSHEEVQVVFKKAEAMK